MTISLSRKVFTRLHYPVDFIAHCVRWYLPYALSLRELEEIMSERGVIVVGNVLVKTPPTLKPMSEQALAAPAGDAGTVSWRTLNDFGGITDVKKAKI